MDDDEIIIPDIQQAEEHYCEKLENNCEDLPATQLLRIKVVISIIIDKYKLEIIECEKKREISLCFK